MHKAFKNPWEIWHTAFTWCPWLAGDVHELFSFSFEDAQEFAGCSKPSQCLIFFLLISVIFTENLFVKYIECALCWESVWENKSDFGAKQNLISLGSCAHQRVFSPGDFVGRAAQQQRCVTAWEELCCWPGAESRECFPVPQQHEHVRLRSSCCRAFGTF